MSTVENTTKTRITFDYGTVFIDCDGQFMERGKYKNKAISCQAFIEKLRGDGYPVAEFAKTYLEKFPFEFEFANGEDIHETFTNYRPGSCMGHDTGKCESMRELYAQNPDDVGTVRWSKNSHPFLTQSGSCLVWKGKRHVYVDRLYGSDGAIPLRDLLFEGISRFMQSLWNLPAAYNVFQGGRKVSFILPRWHEGLMPYMDSFRHAALLTGDRVKVSTCEFDGSRECRSTDGTNIGGKRTKCARGEFGECSCCGYEFENENDDIWTDDSGTRYCDLCYHEHYGYCEYYEETYPVEDLRSVTVLRIRRYSGDRRPHAETLTISDDALRNSFHEYGGEYWDDVEYIHEDLAIDVGDCHVVDEDILGNDDKNEDGVTYRYVYTVHDEYFPFDAIASGDVLWSDAMGGWTSHEYLESVAALDSDPVLKDWIKADAHGLVRYCEVVPGLRMIYDCNSSQPYSLAIRSGITSDGSPKLTTLIRSKSLQMVRDCWAIAFTIFAQNAWQWQIMKTYTGGRFDVYYDRAWAREAYREFKSRAAELGADLA